MKTTPRAGDYVRTAGMTIPQYHAVAKVFIRAGASPGEYPSDYQFNIHEAFGINKNTKSLFHADAKSGDEEYKLNGRELSISDLLGDSQSMAEFLGVVPTIESILKDADASWSGEGLPPVGTDVQYCPNYSTAGTIAYEWYRGKVIAYYDDYIWLSDNGVRPVQNLKFRPLKSEREIAIEEMIKHIKINCYEFVGGSDAKIAGNLYDAGYRRVEK